MGKRFLLHLPHCVSQQMFIEHLTHDVTVLTGVGNTNDSTVSATNCAEYDFGSRCGNISEKAMAPHSSTFAWKIPWMEEPGRLQSMGSLRVGHD